jgi:hypothetical protein
MSSFKKSSM